MMTHNMIKQNLALIITMLYLINSFNDNKYNKYFTILAVLMAFMFPILIIIGVPLDVVILDSWRTITTYFIYYMGFMIIYTMLKVKGFDSTYSLTMAVNTITSCGYLYEIPRFYNLLGLNGLIRYNNGSYDYGMMSTIIMVLLIIKVGYKKWINLYPSIIGYIAYLISYYNPILYEVRLYYKMSLYRMIVLTLLIVLIDGVKE